ncbi:MAG: hypothetical protein ABH811_03010 [archaeon]
MKKGRKKKKYNKKLIILTDGFNGILALLIYNFLLFLSTNVAVGNFVRKIEGVMGYFGLRSFLEMGFNKNEMITGVIIVFLITFLFGVFISKIVRKIKKVEF